MSNKGAIIHVDDDDLFRDIVNDLLEDETIGYDFIQVTSLSEFQEKLRTTRNVIMVILDGNFFDVPNGDISFKLPQAIAFARASGVQKIIAFSSDSTAIQSLPSGQQPDEFIMKGTQSAKLVEVVNDTLSQALV